MLSFVIFALVLAHLIIGANDFLQAIFITLHYTGYWAFIMKEFYSLLSPYFLILFAAWIGHQFFLKQFLRQREAERTSHVLKQKDTLIKEIFDYVINRIEESYEALGEVKSYYICFKNAKSLDPIVLMDYCQEFTEKWFDLDEKLSNLSLACEKYDFMFDQENMKVMILIDLRSQLRVKWSNIAKLINTKKNKVTEEELTRVLEELSQICTTINLSLQTIANHAKSLLKEVFTSLDDQLKKTP